MTTNLRHDTQKPFKIGRVVLYAILSLFVILYIVPIVWLVFASLKDNTSLFSNPWGLPNPLRVENYAEALVYGKIAKYMLNSVIVTTSSLVVSVFLSAMAAYAFARMKWKLSKVSMGVFLVGMMIPIHCTLIPLFIIFTKLHFTDSYLSLIIPYIVFSFPTTIFILTGFFRSIPRELEEAAVIDGCTIWHTFRKIILPIAKPALLTVSIFIFIGNWNELLLALVLVNNDKYKTLPIGLTNFVGMYSTNYTPMLAAIVLAVAPTIILYSIFNAKIISGLTLGAIKG